LRLLQGRVNKITHLQQICHAKFNEQASESSSWKLKQFYRPLKSFVVISYIAL